VRKKQTNKEIEAGLKEGGFETTAKRFSASVAGALFRLKGSREVLRFKDGWGLAEQYSDYLRAKLSQGNSQVSKAKPLRRRRGRPRKSQQIVVGSELQPEAAKPKERVLTALQRQPGMEMSLQELAGHLNMKTRSVNAALSGLLRDESVQKTASGKYRVAT